MEKDLGLKIRFIGESDFTDIFKPGECTEKEIKYIKKTLKSNDYNNLLCINFKKESENEKVNICRMIPIRNIKEAILYPEFESNENIR